jgi:MSHA biogenesis protein MshP
MLPMCRERSIDDTNASRRQRGFSLVAAIFLLVILSALGVFMLSMSTVQQTTSAQDLQGSKAYQAAKAGIEWGAYRILTPENSITGSIVAPYDCLAAAPSPTFAGALTGFSVGVSCTPASVFIEGGNTMRVYQLTAVATFGTSPASNFISRSITATINTCRLGTVAGGAPC